MKPRVKRLLKILKLAKEISPSIHEYVSQTPVFRRHLNRLRRKQQKLRKLKLAKAARALRRQKSYTRHYKG
jgi:hypothetical protein